MTAPTRDIRTETTVAIDVVAAALEIAGHWVGDDDVSSKGGRDVVTAADVAVEDAMRSVLVDAFGLPCVGEERGGDPPADGSAYWLIDPICGTRNYASGLPLYCVNLALVEAGEVTVAAVGDGSTGEVAFAELGQGALAVKDGVRRPLAASDGSRVVVVEDGKSTGSRRARAADFIARVVQADAWDLRSLGSTVSLPYVAAGRVSAYVLFHITAVHVAAGALLAREAGAIVTDLDGRPWSLASDSLIAGADARIHERLLGLLEDPPRTAGSPP